MEDRRMNLTPAEMADWLELNARPHSHTAKWSDFHAIVQFLRRQPTDAQKIEALELAATQAELGVHRRGQWANHRKALRLLGLAHELGPLGESGEHGLPRCR